MTPRQGPHDIGRGPRLDPIHRGLLAGGTPRPRYRPGGQPGRHRPQLRSCRTGSRPGRRRPAAGRRSRARRPGDVGQREGVSDGRNTTTDDDLDRLPTDEDLDRLQWTTVLYYLHETNPDNGLVRDKTDPDAPCSIAAVGLALATIPVVVERGVVIRKFAAKIARRRLRSLLDLPQGPEPDAAGYKGFFYHFLDIETGRRVWECELSTLDSAFLFAGVLTCATYFDADTADEAEVRRLADALYRRADWDWARDGGADAHPRLEAGDRLHPAPLRGLRRGAAALPARPGLADAPAAAGELRRLLRHLPVEGDLRPRAALLRAAVHPPALAPVDRLPRPPRRLHARARQRLLREQPAGDLRAAGVRDPQPAAVRRLRGALLGVHGLRRPRLGEAGGGRGGAAVLRLHRPRRPVRPGRRHGRPVGRGRLAAVRPGDRHPDRPPLRPAEPGR